MLFVLNLYCNTRLNDVDTLGSLQWYMFSKYQYEGDKLPPTKHALLHMMYRSHYMARVWRSSHISKPILPDPCKFGWKLSEDIENCYEPIMRASAGANMDVIQNVALAKTTVLSAVKYVFARIVRISHYFPKNFH